VVPELRKLWIEGPAGRLECALRVACPARAAAVLAHPHPQYGGTLHNPVIYHADRRLHEAGFTSLRFNFRGVGSSDGVYDEGRGEVLDLAAAASWLRGVAGGVPLLLVGYSFGSWCAIRHAAENPSIAAVVAIGLPAREYRLPEVAGLHRPLAVVQGSEDEFGGPEEVRALLDRAHPQGELIVVPGATHLFPGRVPEAAAAVRDAAERCLDRVTPAGPAPSASGR
jgi:uncharacterized protein